MNFQMALNKTKQAQAVSVARSKKVSEIFFADLKKT
jgi:hypothetical protein